MLEIDEVRPKVEDAKMQDRVTEIGQKLGIFLLDFHTASKLQIAEKKDGGKIDVQPVKGDGDYSGTLESVLKAHSSKEIRYAIYGRPKEDSRSQFSVVVNTLKIPIINSPRFPQEATMVIKTALNQGNGKDLGTIAIQGGIVTVGRNLEEAVIRMDTILFWINSRGSRR